ncbi:MAG: transposase, partial [Candidatus Dadabacteria bacterium]|nr:transposase [Candidatus Dadabacteria bacterium]
KIETWRRDYNEFRPHSALDNMTPEEYAKKHSKKPEISNLPGTALG